MPKLTTRHLAVSIIVGGAVLRILLCWTNPPHNTFDEHFEPIMLIMQNGTIPAKDACWQCYHPPVFYWISAMVGNIAVTLGVTGTSLPKLLQFMVCLYGILTLVCIYGILLRFPFSDFARLTALAAASFLPRHIYMSAMNSNDTISYFFVTLSIYLLLLALERKLSTTLLVLASVVMSIALFTKYTAFVVLPAFFAAFAALYWKRLLASRRQIVVSFAFVILLPVLLLGTSLMSNNKRYGSPLPWNVAQLDPSRIHPRDSARLDFASFKPWESIATPIIVPGKMHSFWTLVYTGMWFDNEPKFLYFLDDNSEWWNHYYAWLRGEQAFPSEKLPTSRLTKIVGSGLVALGLVPLLFMFNGLYKYIRGSWKTLVHRTKSEKLIAVKLIVFPALLLSNAAGIIAMAVRLPVYSATKASYFLNCLAAFAVFFALGVMGWEKQRTMKLVIVTAVVMLCALTTVHVLQIVLALGKGQG